MSRCISLGAELAIGCVVALVSVAATSLPANAAATKVNIDPRQRPTGVKTPVEVSVGLYVTNLVAIDETRENFEVGGYLTGTWKDPRLALPADQKSDQNSDDTDGQKTTRAFRVEDL
jgi:hypothetical protein